MTTIVYLTAAVVLALLVAWFVNRVVSVMSGEHPRDTGRQFGGILASILDLTCIECISAFLKRFGWPRWLRWVTSMWVMLLIIYAMIRLFE